MAAASVSTGEESSMTARRNSPRIDQLGALGATRARLAMLNAPSPPKQAEMGGMETSAAVSMLASVQRKQKGKTSQTKVGEQSFDYLCRSHRLPPHVWKFKLLKSEQTPRKDGKQIPRMWEFDFAWPDFMLIVEINGGVWMPGGGAHSHPIDITRNMTKQNDAALAGFFVLQFTPDDVKHGDAIAFTQRVLHERGWSR
jgi:hypothetical protein